MLWIGSLLLSLSQSYYNVFQNGCQAFFETKAAFSKQILIFLQFRFEKMRLLSNCGSVLTPLFDKSRCIDHLLIHGGKMRAGAVNTWFFCGLVKSVISTRTTASICNGFTDTCFVFKSVIDIRTTRTLRLLPLPMLFCAVKASCTDVVSAPS